MPERFQTETEDQMFTCSLNSKMKQASQMLPKWSAAANSACQESVTWQEPTLSSKSEEAPESENSD